MISASDTGEFGLIDRIAHIMPGSPDVIEGIGDDCAVLRVGDRTLLASTDLFVEDIHFRWSYMTGEEVGWKAATAGISDIAAMGGRPLFLLVSLACPANTDTETLEAIARGIATAAKTHGAAVVGGDTTRHPTGVVIDIVALGEAVEGRYITRKGAQPGDILVCTGPFGGSAAGLHALENGIDAPTLIDTHKRPNALIAQGLCLVQQPGVHAMIDVSDGLVQDAGHIATRSNVGIEITSTDVPVHPALTAYCDSNSLNANTLALTGGEEYQLICAVGHDAIKKAKDAYRNEIGTDLVSIGLVDDKKEGVWVDDDRPQLTGFNHFPS